MTNNKNILNRFYVIVALLFVFAIAVGFKMLDIQFAHGKEYEDLAQKRVYKNFTIPANRGNLYDTNGNLLATSVGEYDIHFDALTVSQQDFDENLVPLSQNLSKLLGNTPAYYKNRLKRARQNNNRYLAIAKDLSYSDYHKTKNFPLFKKGPYQGGFITEQHTSRQLPLGKVAKRTVGHDHTGLEGAFNEYLKGKDGHRLKQKIAKGLWKPISDANEVQPEDGQDVYSTIDMNIQDVVHHALLHQLKKYNADHGTAIVMETKTGEIKALANLGRGDKDKNSYYEKRNYAIWETNEPGSTFKLMAMVAALEDNVVDTSTVFDTEGGQVDYFGHTVKDSKIGGYGKISAARGFEVSSNTVFSKIITEGYDNKANEFINRLEYMGLNQKLGLEIKGEGQPHIPHPGDKDWYGTTLPWMSFGYGVSMTPLQILNFYNAIANDGIAIKPQLIKEIRKGDHVIENHKNSLEKTSICSKETAATAQTLLQNVVKKGTGHGIYSEDLPIAGKTGTALIGYGNKDGQSEYAASFAGYFPVEHPKYSTIVIINKPDTEKGFYGAQVAAPAFKQIAKKIYQQTPKTDTLKTINSDSSRIDKNFDSYYALAEQDKLTMPEVKGLPAMDAISLIENLGLQVNLNGNGKVIKQSIPAGQLIREQNTVKLTAL